MLLSSLSPCLCSIDEINRKQSDLVYYSGNALKQRAFHFEKDYLYVQIHHAKGSHYELTICTSHNEEVEVLYSLENSNYHALIRDFKEEISKNHSLVDWFDSLLNPIEEGEPSDEDQALYLKLAEFLCETSYSDFMFKTTLNSGQVLKTAQLKDVPKNNLKKIEVFCYSQGFCEYMKTLEKVNNDFGLSEEYAPFIQHTKTSYSTLVTACKKEGVTRYVYKHQQNHVFWFYDSKDEILYFDCEDVLRKDVCKIACTKDRARDLIKLEFVELYNETKIKEEEEFEDYLEAVERSVNENYGGTKEDFLIDYVHLKVKIIEEASDYSISSQQIESHYSEKGLSENLLFELSGFDVIGLYDESNYHVTYYTGFRKKPVTNYSIRYKLVFSRPLYTYETDLLKTQFGLKG